MKTKDIVLKFGKILLVFCTLFSQLSFSLEAFAEEVVNDDDSKVEEINELTEEDEVNKEEDVIEDTHTDKVNGTYAGDDTVLTDEENSTDENVTEDTEEDNTEEGVSDVSVDVVIDEEDAIVLGTFSENLTVSMLRNSLSRDYDGSVILVLDGDSELDDDDIVTSDMLLSIDGNEYTIFVIGDFDNDGIVDQNDVNYIIDDILDGDEGILDVSDAAYVNASIKNNEWLQVLDTTDVLNLQSVTDASVLVGDTFNLNLIVSGFAEDFINGIQGIVSYDESLLELKDISVKNVVSGDKNEEGKFVYLLEDYNNSDDVLLTFTFVALAEGEASVSINDVIAARDGAYVSFEYDNNSIETTVSIAPVGMGGYEDDVIEETTAAEPVVVNTSDVVNMSKVTYVVLSSNNYISSLKIKGYDIDFDKYNYEYNVTVGSDVKSLNLDIILDSAYATYVVNGNGNFKTGKNVVEIVVTAEDGSSRTYTINVDKKAKDVVKEESNEKSNVSRIIIIVLIILVIIGLIYVIFRDDEEDTPKDNKKNDNKKKNNTKKKK